MAPYPEPVPRISRPRDEAEEQEQPEPQAPPLRHAILGQEALVADVDDPLRGAGGQIDLMATGETGEAALDIGLFTEAEARFDGA